MSDDGDDAEGGSFWGLIGLGAAAAAGAVWWLTQKGSKQSSNNMGMTEAEVLDAFKTADVITSEGRRRLAEAQATGAVAERKRRGEPVDESIVALERIKAQRNWDWNPKGTAFLNSITAFEKAITRPVDLDPADLRRNPTRHHLCQACQGAGKNLCPRCRGVGRESIRNFYGQLASVPCPMCGGAGTTTCQTCKGQRILYP